MCTHFRKPWCLRRSSKPRTQISLLQTYEDFLHNRLLSKCVFPFPFLYYKREYLAGIKTGFFSSCGRLQAQENRLSVQVPGSGQEEREGKWVCSSIFVRVYKALIVSFSSLGLSNMYQISRLKVTLPLCFHQVIPCLVKKEERREREGRRGKEGDDRT